MKKNAVSLVEVIVAALIISLIMLGMANIFLVARRYLLHAKLRMTGGELGHFFLDPLQKEQVRQDRWDTTCLGTGTCQDETAGSPEGLDRSYTAHYTVTPNFSGTSLSKVKVEINWTE